MKSKFSNFKLKIIQIISSKAFFFLITTAIILTLNLTPLVMQFRHAPEGRTFALIHNNAQDFFFYQSLMNEGANGAWMTSDPYTSEPHQSSIIFSYFLWLGKLSKLLGLPYAVTYHLIRIMLSVILLSFIFYLLSFIKIPHPRLTYLFFLFAAPFMHKTADGSIVPYMNWWTGMDPIRRMAYLPHHMFGGLLLVITIIMIIKFIKESKLKYLLSLIFISVLLAFVHTPSLFILLLILPVTLFLHVLIHQEFSFFNFHFSLNFQTLKIKNYKFIENYKLKISNYIGLLIYWVTGLLMLLFMVSQTRNGFPWSQYIDWEKNLQFPLDRELIGALGILFPFSLLGAWQAIKSKKFEYILITCWLFIPFLFIPLAPKIGLSNIRLIQGVPYLPLAILSTIGMSKILLFIIKYIVNHQFSFFNFQIKNLKFNENFKLKIENYLVCVFFVIFIIFTFPTLQWSLQDQIREYWPIFGNVYLDNRLNNAFSFINQNFPAKTVSLSTFYTGNYLPAFTRTVSFIGHFGYTYNEKEKEEKTQKFFKGKMTDEEAKEFLMSNKIALIWQGPEEKPIYKDYLYPKILKPVYDKEEVIIYLLNL